MEESSITIGLLGSNHEITKLIGESLGSPGTRSDLQFYNRLDAGLGAVFTAVAPTAYPDKIKSLLQTCAETSIHIMVIDAETGITAEIGEIMVAMSLFSEHYATKSLAVIGGLNSSNEWRVEEILKKITALTSTTVLKGMSVKVLKSREDYDHLKQTIVEMNLNQQKEKKNSINYCKVLIDHAFPVKGVGTVALGLVSRGEIKSGEMYDLIPVQKKVILRSIQKFDRDFKSAKIGDRVGLALKGVKAEKIDRNTIFCTMGAFTTSDHIKAKIYVSPYYRPQNENGKISPKDAKTYHLIADLSISPAKLLSGDDIGPGKSGVLELELDKPLAHDSSGLRGILAEFGPFENKLRIVGYVEQIQ
ncbi:MAG: hypothetical protein ACTSWX_09540 [Promethearchaeota archaeon]